MRIDDTTMAQKLIRCHAPVKNINTEVYIMEKNLTTGSVMKTLVTFSLPFLLSYFLQTLYGLADLFIIGQFCPTEATTAVSIGSQVMHMLTVMIVGLAMGSTVLIGKAVGASDSSLRNKAIGNTVTLFLIVSLCLTLLLVILVNPIVSVMATPIEAVAGTRKYLLICFVGIPFITSYNIISSVFRGMGDSKSPMYIVAVACVFNIVLDYVFIGVLNLGPAGAALGTTIAQAISVIIAIVFIINKDMIRGLSPADLRPVKNIIRSITAVGIPVAAQDGFIQISFIVITIFANRRGLVDSAAVGVVEKLIGILFLVPSTLLASVSALCAQNIGAKRHDRARKTMLDAMLIVVIFGTAMSIIFQFAAPYAVGMFSKDPAVIVSGSAYMRSYVFDCIFAGLHFVFSGYFCAYSKSGLSFMHNLASVLLARIPLAYFASVHYMDTLFPMGMAAPAGSVLSVLICIAAYMWMQKNVVGKNDL